MRHQEPERPAPSFYTGLAWGLLLSAALWAVLIVSLLGWLQIFGR